MLLNGKSLQRHPNRWRCATIPPYHHPFSPGIFPASADPAVESAESSLSPSSLSEEKDLFQRVYLFILFGAHPHSVYILVVEDSGEDFSCGGILCLSESGDLCFVLVWWYRREISFSSNDTASSVADYECECWRADPALAAGANALSTPPPPCVLEMTLEPPQTTKKKKPPKPPKRKTKPLKQASSRKTTTGRCRRCCGRFAAFLFSHVGLCALVVGYSVAGAFAFRALEAPFEEKKASQVSNLRLDTVKRLWEITDKLNVLYKDNWTELVEAEVRRFQRDLVVAVKEGYDGKEGRGQQWSFSGAFLYSLTVITTIGE
ncbi:hypothetical protein JTE90_014146 [Oedothorax gibbosus]|uniref:TWiK family of potassium channels protein 7 n=1 Tax=Oedothorax gibbosus TaxID=931172 RepID=A0AAV6VJB5_9ARAC|nr:hypothetical protein JTE90_014146 [Oedothorax gibbosus]